MAMAIAASAAASAGVPGGGGVPGKVGEPVEAVPPLDMRVVADDETLRQYQCGICFGLLKDPKQCTNGHLFCDLCILQCLQKSSDCPHCRCDLSVSLLSRSLFVENAIHQLTVRCQFFYTTQTDIELERRNGVVDGVGLEQRTRRRVLTDEETWVADEERGCPTMLKLEQMPAHEKKCEFSFRPCEWGAERCPRIRLNKWQEHSAECPFRPSHCRACDKDVPQSELAAHTAACPKVVIGCPDCGSFECLREKLEDHQLKECPDSLLSCEFEGCSAPRMKRSELEGHMRDFVVEHTRLLQSSFKKQVTELKEQHAHELVARDDKMRRLERLVERSETRIEWRVRNWSRVKSKGYLQSERFTFANMQWFIGFYTNGDSPDSAGSISEYLFLDTSSCPSNKRVTIEFALRFVNHKDASQTVKKEFKTQFPIRGGQGWGDRRALAVSRLTEEEGFIHRDTLVMDATITLKRTSWTV
jgi:MATH domain/TRAF-type zinc finger/Zinc finger, C3HC4 type (RING finger)